MALIGSYYGKSNKTIHVGNVRCQGDEASLQQCSKTEYGLKEVLASDASVAGVSCVPNPAVTVTNAAVTVTNAPFSNTISNTSSATTISTIILAFMLAIVLIIGIVM